ncbi:MAG: hypothetical protein IKS40_00645 [Treponema sp.]|nr:hypothetical protein [Treponema sp.]
MPNYETMHQMALLLQDKAFCNKLGNCHSEKDIAETLKEFNLQITEEDIHTLFTNDPQALKFVSEIADFSKRLNTAFLDEKIKEDFYKITSPQDFSDFCEKHVLTPTPGFTSMVELYFLVRDTVQNLSEEELDSIAGGSLVMDAVKFGVGFIPGVGGLATAALDIADGSVHGKGSITARLAGGVGISLFSTVGSLSFGGGLSIAKAWRKQGLTPELKEKLALFGGISALSGITSFAVKQATT